MYVLLGNICPTHIPLIYFVTFFLILYRTPDLLIIESNFFPKGFMSKIPYGFLIYMSIPS